MDRLFSLRRWAALFAAALLLPLTAQAQSTGEGTIYSRYGLGTLESFSSSQADAMGGGGYALRTLNYNPMGNPALWSDQFYTRLHAGVEFQTINITDGAGTTGTLSSGSLQTLQFSFPILKRKLGFGLSFQPYSRMNYRAQRTGTVAIGPDREGSSEYTTSFQGTGGLQLLRSGLGYRLSDALSVGATADVIFGIVESQRRTSFASSFIGRDALVSDATRLAGATGTAGMHLTLESLLKNQDNFSLGASVTLPAVLSGERVRTLDESLARDTLASVNGDVTLPWSARVGVSYQPNELWTVVADGEFAPWSGFESDFTAGTGETTPFPIGGLETMTDRWRVSAGAEVVPAGTDQLAGYFARTAYRFGVYTERLYVRPDLQTNVNVWGLTGGVSLPTSLSGTRIDLNLRAGMRGTTEADLVRDTFYGVALYLNFGERWFQERKLR